MDCRWVFAIRRDLGRRRCMADGNGYALNGFSVALGSVQGRNDRARMSSVSHKIVQACLETPTSGLIELAHDWGEAHSPGVCLSGDVQLASLERAPASAYGVESGYFVGDNGEICFVVLCSKHPRLDPTKETLYLAGDFNGWVHAIGKAEWAMRAGTVEGQAAWLWTGPMDRFRGNPWPRFKFVTAQQHWLPVPDEAPNVVRDVQGNINYQVNPDCTGRHVFRFTLHAPLDLSRSWRIAWREGKGDSAILRPTTFFHALASELPLGAIVRNGQTTFRLFAPRASRVELCVCGDLADEKNPHRYELKRRWELGPDEGDEGRWNGIWEVILNQALHGWFYWYHVDGPKDELSSFDPAQRVLDPYAWAAVSRSGPGIVLDATVVGTGDRHFRTPVWHDLVIAEAHVRDLIAGAPIVATDGERRGFAGLLRWVESPSFYLDRLGVNCVELQPIQQNDAQTPEEYHWGYMTTNWFSPSCFYASDPATGSGVREFQELIAAFHRRRMAVVVDVVYNHVGVPAGLALIDKLYYFEVDNAGGLSNWSGCGNDYRARSAMAKRLIIDSCRHLIEVFGVDGFRFDLAELIGVEVLREIEAELKRVKHDVILIAEPWSFRGHIAGALSETGWASWNDGYRNCLRDYIRGGSTAAQLEYFLKGSPWYFARWPAQTVNYTESHDDRTWIDNITEHAEGNGAYPTAQDRRRTHLMAAILFASIGIPMISAGQDFLRSKHGVNNTYLRGDLNALDYRRLYRFSGTHAYFAEWIAFRLSERGRLFRQWSRPSEGFFRSYTAAGANALAIIYNADRSQGPERLLFAINPAIHDVSIPLDAESAGRSWRQIADHERFSSNGLRGMPQPIEQDLYLPALSCGLWICWS